MRASQRELARALPSGYRITNEGSRNGHLHIVCPDGTQLRGPDGVPVRLSTTPGDKHHSLAKSLAKIRRALEGRADA